MPYLRAFTSIHSEIVLFKAASKHNAWKRPKNGDFQPLLQNEYIQCPFDSRFCAHCLRNRALNSACERDSAEAAYRIHRLHPPGLKIRSVLAGLLTNFCADRVGRGAKPPPQFGHTPASTWFTQAAQKVHSKEQIMASWQLGGSGLSQHSQDGRSSSIFAP